MLLVLHKNLKENLQASKAYECLKIMCEDSIKALEKGNNELITFSRWKLKACYEGVKKVEQTDPKELQKWIDDKQLNKCLNNLVSSHLQDFQSLGYIPTVKKNETRGGQGNERVYWIDIEELVSTELEATEESVDIDTITYVREKPELIKVSLFYRLLFRQGELKNRSVQGAILILLIFFIVVFWILYLVSVSIVLTKAFSVLSQFNLICVVATGIFTAIMWKCWLLPIWNLPEHRVIKAPSVFLAINESEAEIEIYRDQDRNQITRFTRFTATCPICTADVVLRAGQPDQKAPLVGRCVESPFAHVYSFDRVMLQGKRLS